MIPDYMDRKHDYSFARERQLQNKLIAADDIFDQSELTSNISAPRLSNLKDSKFVEVTGWNPSDKVLLRKSENDNVLCKPRTSVGTREGLLTRDRSRRDLHDSSYAFHHYPESHRYIEQYRREHTCTDSTNSATTRNEFLELQRFYAYRSQTGSLYTHPTAVGYIPHSQIQTHALSRARESSGVPPYRSSEPCLRSASRYKLSPSLNVRSEQELSTESEQTEPGPLQVGANTGSTSKMAIHAITKTPIPKVPAKVTVPANQSMISPSLSKTMKAGRKTGSPKTSVAAWENGVGAMRTLDTLACVARPGEKTSRTLTWLTIQVPARLEAAAEDEVPWPEGDWADAQRFPGQGFQEDDNWRISQDGVHSNLDHQEEGNTPCPVETGFPGKISQSVNLYAPADPRFHAHGSPHGGCGAHSTTTVNAASGGHHTDGKRSGGVPDGERPGEKGENLMRKIQAPAVSRSAQSAACSNEERLEQEAKEANLSDTSSTPVLELCTRFDSAAAETRGGMVGNERAQSLQERRENLMLAPIRQGQGEDEAITYYNADGGLERTGQYSINIQDGSSHTSESVDSSLEVIFSDPAETDLSEDDQGQDDDCSSQEQSGDGRYIRDPDPVEETDKHSTLYSTSLFNRSYLWSHEASFDDPKKGAPCERPSLNARQSRTTNPNVLESNKGSHPCQERTNDSGVSQTENNSRAQNPDCIAGWEEHPIFDQELPVSLPTQLNKREKMTHGTSPAISPSRAGEQSSQTPDSARLSREIESQKRQITTILETGRPRQGTYLSIRQQLAYRGQSEGSSPYLQIPYAMEGTKMKRKSLSPHQQTLGHRQQAARNRIASLFNNTDRETLRHGENSEIVRMSGTSLSRPTQASSRSLQRVRTALMGTSNLPVYTFTGPKQGSPRKGIPRPSSHHTPPMLVYHNDIGDMMVVGTSRPNTSPSQPSSTASSTASRRAVTTAGPLARNSRSHDLKPQTRNKGVKVDPLATPWSSSASRGAGTKSSATGQMAYLKIGELVCKALEDRGRTGE